MTARAIVLDANILVRAVLDSRVPELLAAHAAQATFRSNRGEPRLIYAVISTYST